MVANDDPKASRIDLASMQIDPATAETFIAERKIGERIKKLRLKKSMGLVELGRHTGLSASFLSQLETGRVVPTLRNLARIAMVFNKDLSYFFEPEPHTLFRIHRKHERVRLPQTGVDDPTYYFESLAYMVPDRHLDPYYAEFIPVKANTDVRPHVHPGYEFLYMLEGELELRHADKAHVMEAGDSVYFDASTPHSYRCSGKTSALALIVTMHQQHIPQPAMNLRPLGTALGTRVSAGPTQGSALRSVDTATEIAKPRPALSPNSLRRN
ncbi:MAG: helix-turn-helix transcriptional regulator [Silvibacterium sp.]|nr:helix-turn-helix transcriptional regulator [Silvibacterium sp.]MBV8437802.1 helix-turn-helix transcriptional regulator [Silvibacterium sp.]